MESLIGSGISQREFRHLLVVAKKGAFPQEALAAMCQAFLSAGYKAFVLLANNGMTTPEALKIYSLERLDSLEIDALKAILSKTSSLQ